MACAADQGQGIVKQLVDGRACGGSVACICKVQSHARACIDHRPDVAAGPRSRDLGGTHFHSGPAQPLDQRGGSGGFPGVHGRSHDQDDRTARCDGSCLDRAILAKVKNCTVSAFQKSDRPNSGGRSGGTVLGAGLRCHAPACDKTASPQIVRHDCVELVGRITIAVCDNDLVMGIKCLSAPCGAFKPPMVAQCLNFGEDEITSLRTRRELQFGSVRQGDVARGKCALRPGKALVQPGAPRCGRALRCAHIRPDSGNLPASGEWLDSRFPRNDFPGAEGARCSGDRHRLIHAVGLSRWKSV